VKAFNVWGISLKEKNIKNLKESFESCFIGGELKAHFYKTRKQAKLNIRNNHYKVVKVEIAIHD
jgi:hypothetical protein